MNESRQTTLSLGEMCDVTHVEGCQGIGWLRLVGSLKS